MSSLIFRSYLSQNGCGSRNYTSVGKSIAAENARETDGLVHTTTRVPTVRDGFDKQHADMRLSPFELGSKEIERIANYVCRHYAEHGQPLRDKGVPPIRHTFN